VFGCRPWKDADCGVGWRAFTLVSRELLERAVEAHGHLGPFLVLGLRMGLLAERLLGGRVQACEVEVVGRRPLLCAVDGIRAVVGDEVSVVGGGGISATFHGAEGRKITVKVRGSVIERYARVAWEECEERAREVLGEREENILLVVGNPKHGSRWPGDSPELGVS